MLQILRKLTRVLAPHRGLRRISEGFQEYFASVARFELIHDFDGDLQFGCHLDSHISSQIFWRGSYSTTQLRLLDRMLGPDFVFFDIGANEGEHTVFCAKRLSRGKVYSFEPNSKIFDRLNQNLDLNAFQSRVSSHRIGLGRETASLPLYGSSGPESDGSKNEGLSSLHARAGVSAVLEEIRVVRLDDFVRDQKLDRLDMMKIDVEGSELAVLEGGVETIRRFRPLILIEVSEKTSIAAGYSTQQLLSYLSGFGYQFENILNSGLTAPVSDLRHASRDVLCRPH